MAPTTPKPKKTAPKKKTASTAPGRKRSAPRAKSSESQIEIGSKFGEQGASGLKHFGGRVQDEFIRELQGSRGIKKLDQFRRNDAVAGGMLRAMTMLTRSVEWIVDPCDDDAVPGEVQLEDQAYLESCMNDMERTWADFISEVATMYWAGFSLFEEVYKVRAGMGGPVKSRHADYGIGWGKLAFRAQETIEEWVLSRHGEILGAQQQDISSGITVTMPIDKLLLFRTTTEKNNPGGESLLRNAYRDWVFKTGIEEIEGIGVERDVAGIPKIRIPSKYMAPGADPSVYNNYKKIGRNIRIDEQGCLVIPSDTDDKGNFLFDVELLGAPGSKQFDIDKIIQRHNMAMAVSVLADFILLGHEKVGSFALADSKTALFATALGGFLDMIAEVLNCTAVPRLWEMNGWQRPTPTFRHSDIETIDLGALSQWMTAATGAGIDLTDPQTENEIRRQAGMPQTAEETADDIDEGADADDINLPPADDRETTEPAEGGDAALLSTVGGLNALMDLAAKVQAGELPEANALVMATEVLGLAPDVARRLLARDEGLAQEEEVQA